MATPPPLTLIIRPVPPFRLDLTAWALRRRPRNLIDRWDGSTYRRVILISGRPLELAVRQVGSATESRLMVRTASAPRTTPERRRIRTVLDRLLGLHVDLTGWYRVAARDARLHALAQRFRGVKPRASPRCLRR
jgi:DNA-3-methyladenine glycosylase II